MSVPPALLRDIETILGRVNALHAFCMVMAESLPNETLAVAAKAMKTGYAKVEADALACPISENTLREMLRVMTELQMMLQTNSAIPPDADRRN
jgi:hypothetical protein